MAHVLNKDFVGRDSSATVIIEAVPEATKRPTSRTEVDVKPLPKAPPARARSCLVAAAQDVLKPTEVRKEVVNSRQPNSSTAQRIPPTPATAKKNIEVSAICH